VTAGDRPEALHSLLAHSTRLHAWVALPAGAAVFILAEPLLDLWVARRASAAADLVPMATPIVQVLIFGLTVRAMADNWARVLYGAGHVSKYAMSFLIGGLLNPVISLVLITRFQGDSGIVAPAIAFSLIALVVHFLWLPAIAAKCLGVSYVSLFTPMLRPTLVTIACAPILLAANMIIGRWTLVHLAVVFVVFSAVYAGLSWLFVVTKDERTWIRGVAARRGARRGAGRAAGKEPITRAIEAEEI
jgi:O-antigen/teichoic acid export membrane protein